MRSGCERWRGAWHQVRTSLWRGAAEGAGEAILGGGRRPAPSYTLSYTLQVAVAVLLAKACFYVAHALYE